MTDWTTMATTDGVLLLGSSVLGVLAGRLCAWIACWLPPLLEDQWHRDAQEVLGLPLDKTQDSRPPAASRLKPWIVQIACSALSLVVALQLGPTFQAMLAMLLTWWLLILSLIDWEHRLLPDALVIPGLWAGLVINSFGVFATLQEALWGSLFGWMSLWSVCQLAKLITGQDSIGRGDFKLLALLGAWGGMHIIGWTIIGAMIGAALLALALKLLGKVRPNTKIPFGPFLSAAGWTATLAAVH